MRIVSTGRPTYYSPAVRPKTESSSAENTCSPVVQATITDLLESADQARQTRSKLWAAAAVGGLATTALAGAGQAGLAVGLGLGTAVLGVLGMKEAVKGAGFTIQAADLASEHGCQIPQDPRMPGNEYFLFDH